MSIEQTLQITSLGSAQTETFGEQLGQKLKGGEVIVLTSDLGGGKTTLVRGVARGLGSTDLVNSPTFMLSRIYRGKKLTLHHFDFYRLNEAGILGNEIAEILDDKKAVIVVEWADLVKDFLGREVINIELTRNSSDENHRTITLFAPASYAYLTRTKVAK